MARQSVASTLISVEERHAAYNFLPRGLAALLIPFYNFYECQFPRRRLSALPDTSVVDG